MKKTVFFVIAILTVLVIFTECNNFFHELVPPDENRITSFSVTGQLGAASIGETDITVTVGPGVDLTSLIPGIAVSAKASLLPVTLPYIQRAFPSSNIFRDGMAFYTSQDRSGYAIDLIKQNRDFNVPVVNEAIDFSDPVTFLVVSGLGTIRQYTVNVEVDTGEGKFFSFGFAKFDNSDLTRGDAAGIIDNIAKTVVVEVWYPVENIASYKLIPSFETNGATVSVDGTELQSGNGEIDFDKPASSAELISTQTKTLMVQRPGFDPVSYQLSVTFKEDLDTDRSITDFRFNAAINYGIQYTAMGEITSTGDTGTITVKVHYTGDVPAALVPSFVSPGTVSVDGVTQQSGTGSRDFSEPLYYRVVSHDGNYNRTYRVTVDFVNETDARPKLNGFTFTTAANPSLAAATSALIDHEAGLVVIEAVYTGDSPPTVLVPEFSAGGNVTVAGIMQQSGVSAQNFSGKVKYTVRESGNPNLFRDYWVEARFVQDSLSLAELSEFRFFKLDNPGLCEDVRAAEIDQAAGTIYAILPFTNLGPLENGGHRKLYPRWLGQGTVSIGGAVQTSGQSGTVLGHQTVYRVTSADGAFFKDYTVKVLEVNTRIYVNAGAAGDNTGVSWANAFRSLADACKAAEDLPAALPAEVWIAEGIYRPSETRDAAAYLKVSPNTGYYGGFAGTETAKEARDPATHQVTITGDLGGGVYAEHLFMNVYLGGNAAFGEMKLTGARALTWSNKSGPAIYVMSGNTVTVTNTVFEDLQAGSSGGAVYASGGSTTITDSEFTDIHSAGSGGAVYASGSLSLARCGFENIQSGGSGEVVYASASGSNGFVSITDCDFSHISTESSGRVVYASATGIGGSISITRCKFKNTQSVGQGGAVYASVTGTGGSISITGSNFTGIQSAGNGGAVYAYTSGSVTITDCKFEDIQSGSSGGAVYASGSVSITGSKFKNTQSVSQGGAVYASGSLSITGSNFTDIQGAGAGGAVYVSNYNNSVSLTNCGFERIQVTSTSSSGSCDGGAVYISASNGSVNITNCNFKDTKATELPGFSYSYCYGGAIFVIAPSSSVDITKCNFEGTKAIGTSTPTYSSGGAVYIVGTSFATNITECRFTSTQTSGYGGALRVAGSTSITDCAFTDIWSGSHGAIASLGPLTCVLSEVSFSGCTAPYGSILYGGAIYPDSSPLVFTVKPGCSIDGISITTSTILAQNIVLLVGGATIMVVP